MRITGCALAIVSAVIAVSAWAAESPMPPEIAQKLSEGLSRPSTAFRPHLSEDVDARHNGPVLGPAKPDPSAGHDENGAYLALRSRLSFAQ